MSLLILVGLFGLVYVFFLRPRAQAARRQRDTLMELNAGDEVLTAAGIFGTVLDVESDRVTLETAPGTRITVVRSTIARRITQPEATEPSWDEHDDDEVHDAYHDYKSGSDDDEDAEHDHDEVEDHDEVDEPEEVDEDDDSAEDHDHDADEAEAGEHDGTGVADTADTADTADAADTAQSDGVAADDQDATAGGRRGRRKRRPA